MDLLAGLIESHSAEMMPVVLSELLSQPGLPEEVERFLTGVPMVRLEDGFWRRAGKLRASLFERGMRPRLADTLIAQTCLDRKASLLTRDRGFERFSEHAGLRLM